MVKRFERQVHQHPDPAGPPRPARPYTYSELNAAANRVAHALIALRGEGSETVALLFENGAPFVVASLGVLKAGKIQVPLDSTFPRARLSYMLQQSGAAVVMTDGCNLPLAQDLGALSVVNIEEIDDCYPRLTELILGPMPCLCRVHFWFNWRTERIVRNHRGVMHAMCITRIRSRIGMHDRLIMSRAGLRPRCMPCSMVLCTIPSICVRKSQGVLQPAGQQEITIYGLPFPVFGV